MKQKAEEFNTDGHCSKYESSGFTLLYIVAYKSFFALIRLVMCDIFANSWFEERQKHKKCCCSPFSFNSFTWVAHTVQTRHLTFKALPTDRPPYFTYLFQHRQLMKSLPSTLYFSISKSFGSRAFHFSALWIWNSLPLCIHESQPLPTFNVTWRLIFSVSVSHQVATNSPVRHDSLTDLLTKNCSIFGKRQMMRLA